MSWKVKLNILLLSGLFIACGGGSDNPGSDPDPEPDPVPAPRATTLIFPENNSECTTGVVVSDTQSQVLFEWNESENTDSYEVNLRNLNTNNTSRFTSNTNSVNITLNRGTPYEWFVVSRADGTSETANSPSWRFYNEGPGIENYAPFPAVAISPERGAILNGITSVDLSWTGSDVDNDIVDYEVYLDTNTDPTTSLGITAETSLPDVAVSAGNVYYWKVVTRDSQGNSSTSEIFQFRVD
ncbi:hypothetical protein [Lentiprolixibacter aurantiacus]|uniref:Fibronectin type-III domain-containing protein n=1 Tax=Lentiprolixibacter aurantiacus TaxID=2993939 RepID=A0AAE3MHP3_9FLAO|nr:hypothetical protein [Lentiprolixibacter aurantiacus]MCX2717970.1 hypothetical protein [Lentiprolixibacter aurantiacus]